MTLKHSILYLLNFQPGTPELLESVLGASYTKGAVANEIKLLIKENLIETSDSKLALTISGHRILNEVICYRNKGFSWDGLFRLVSFNIPESQRGKRDKLRRELKSDGYRQLMGALWINFFDTELTKQLMNGENYPYVEVIKGIRVGKGESDEKVISRIFDLHDLNSSYSELNRKWDRAWASPNNAAQTSREAISILGEYLNLVAIDCRVPDKLMPELAVSRLNFEENIWQLMNLAESYLMSFEAK